MRHASLNYLFSGVERIKGVGRSMSEALSHLLPAGTLVSGASAPIIRDLLFHLPVGIIDRRASHPLVSVPEGVVTTCVVTVETHIPPPIKRGTRRPYKVICGNETGTLVLVFFHAKPEFLKQQLPLGAKRVVSGTIERFEGLAQMTHPDVITTPDKLAQVQSVEPVYPLTANLSGKRLRQFIGLALEQAPALPEWLSAETLAAHHFPAWKEALTLAHSPKNADDILPNNPARLRLAYDELLARQLRLALLRAKRAVQAGVVLNGNGALVSALIESLPFALTEGQKRVGDEIARDLASGHRMVRLLQGDVGSGKTLVALIAMLRAVECGKQAALMVPTELVARQHFETISKIVEGGSWMVNGEKNTTHHPPPTTILLTGSIKGKERESALAAISSGAASIIIGTHALFQEQVVFHDLALAVIDEQHRFGVAQRMALAAKGAQPHLLHMTATPIPRTLTLALYGDMESSILTEKPAGRQKIHTAVIPLSRYEEVLTRLKAALDRGEKAYWICPLVDEGVDGGWWSVNGEEASPTTIHHSPSTDLAAATLRHTEFKARFGSVVGLVHGQMKAEQRDREMQRFASGDARLLVATTVVEVGVDVRDATIMVIEKAERFGLSQLHQLRGRVGRGKKASSCVLLYSEVTGGSWMVDSEKVSATNHQPPTTNHRLSVLRDSDDGFKIAEEDLRLRGGGDVMGLRQSGLPRAIFPENAFNISLLERARHEAEAVLSADPALSDPKNEPLHLLMQLFETELINA